MRVEKLHVATLYMCLSMYMYERLRCSFFQLIKLHAVSRDLLPPKRYHGNLSKSLIDQRRLQLESYLQKLIHRLMHGEGIHNMLVWYNMWIVY